MTADQVLQLMVFTFSVWGVGCWLSQKEWGTDIRTRSLMFIAFGLFGVGAISGFLSFLGLVTVSYTQWHLPWYVEFIVAGAYMYGLVMAQMGSMRGFKEWSDGRVERTDQTKHSA